MVSPARLQCRCLPDDGHGAGIGGAERPQRSGHERELRAPADQRLHQLLEGLLIAVRRLGQLGCRRQRRLQPGNGALQHDAGLPHPLVEEAVLVAVTRLPGHDGQDGGHEQAEHQHQDRGAVPPPSRLDHRRRLDDRRDRGHGDVDRRPGHRRRCRRRSLAGPRRQRPQRTRPPGNEAANTTPASPWINRIAGQPTAAAAEPTGNAAAVRASHGPSAGLGGRGNLGQWPARQELRYTYVGRGQGPEGGRGLAWVNQSQRWRRRRPRRVRQRGECRVRSAGSGSSTCRR